MYGECVIFAAHLLHSLEKNVYFI